MQTAEKPTRKIRQPNAKRPIDHGHHLILNREFWWVCCSINATRQTKEKLSHSLRTKCFKTARLRRDVFMRGLQAEGLEVRLRQPSSCRLGALKQVSAERMTVPWKQRVAEVLAVALSAELKRPARLSAAKGEHLFEARLRAP